MNNRRIKISQPKVLIGDRVLIRNYRRSGSPLEEAIVNSVEFKVYGGKCRASWSYGARTLRKTPRGYGVDLTVGEEDIKLLSRKELQGEGKS